MKNPNTWNMPNTWTSSASARSAWRSGGELLYPLAWRRPAREAHLATSLGAHGVDAASPEFHLVDEEGELATRLEDGDGTGEARERDMSEEVISLF